MSDHVDKAQAWDASRASYQKGYDRGVAEAAAENAALRQIISDAAEAIGNGAFIAPTCSIEFMGGLPNEIRLHIASITTNSNAQAE
ncbi:hypothetical protein KYK30_31660 [Shinella yambaruensis]|uniref:Uncharacterized protein n=1 Tax=Shinella yambaruensis TaxID=415996 RepID=A0ABQ5ZTN1_9HYPH|nr:hypothetical protein [Shinella yambaruensis]MCJ8029990.1 hypothetical protein [Shinella yambaruensis]MCU7984282.1 hypothetical protein [Shinella yambaruensis]GLR55111.1 hypothetical protein GCM10007923_63320 [Shinella yambaruensis]